MHVGRQAACVQATTANDTEGKTRCRVGAGGCPAERGLSPQPCGRRSQGLCRSQRTCQAIKPSDRAVWREQEGRDKDNRCGGRLIRGPRAETLQKKGPPHAEAVFKRRSRAFHIIVNRAEQDETSVVCQTKTPVSEL